MKLMDKSERTDGTLSRSDFAFDPEGNLYVCPAAEELKKYHRSFPKPRDGVTKDGTLIYFARSTTATPARLNLGAAQNVPARKIASPIHEAARDKACKIAKTEAYAVSCRERKKVEMLFRSSEAHPQAGSIAPPRSKRSQRRVPLRPLPPKICENWRSLSPPAPILAT